MTIKSHILIVLLSLTCFIEAQVSKIAFLTVYENAASITDDDELAAYNWFKNNYAANGELLTVASLQNNEKQLSTYQLIWLHTDRENNTGEIPNSLLSSEILQKFQIYLQQGGKLLLTNQATQYLYYIGRSKNLPQMVSAGSATFNTELWTVNPNIELVNNYSLHPIYDGLSSSNQYGYNTFRLISSGLKENHAALWDLNQSYITGNVLNQFEKENNARVIGTLGNSLANNLAGIVEFFPNEQFSGRCISIGLGAYEWNQNDKLNPYQSNIEKLTSNAIDYLLNQESEPVLAGQLVAHFPFELNETKTSVKETVADRSFIVENNQIARENIPGADGNALRFDGFSTYCKARFNNTTLTNQAFSGSIWFAPESYPMMNPDVFDASFTHIAGNMTSATGFAFSLNSLGKYGVEIFIDSLKYTCYAKNPLPKYDWNFLAFNVSLSKKEIQFYNNGEIVAKTYFKGNQINYGQGILFIGKSSEDRLTGPFRTNTVNGLIDEFKLFAGETDFYKTPTPQNDADLSIPVSRFENQIHRPMFHGQPGANWTNEPHGLVYYNNQYHMFFQKNGNGPYWGRIHWGHIVSKDLLKWNEIKTAIDPSEAYDLKGAWSGCVFTDENLTKGKPYLFYTSADYAKASISVVTPKDTDLNEWEKNPLNPVIPSRPAGLDDDFRDPCVFKNGDKYYMIVGTKKDGKGACTLHEFNQATQKWSNDGRIFFKSPSTDYGTFWEMPVIVPFSNGKWLFAATPLGAKNGVETFYWVGQIISDGTFAPFSTVPGEVELGNMSKQGYGLLSPSVMQKDGKNIAVGIVPDKLSGDYNKQLGWAHLFSLPREWNLDANNQLIQTPYEGVQALRNSAMSFELNNSNVNNQTISMNPVNGKSLEIKGNFSFNDSDTHKFGFNLRKNGLHAVQVYYDIAANTFNVDCRNTNRWINDNIVYNGLYSTVLPEKPAGNLKMNIFLDGSIMDVFLNDRWAFSIRLFVNDAGTNETELFSTGAIQVNSLNAWKITANDLSQLIDPVKDQNAYRFYFSQGKLYCKSTPENACVNIFDLTGRKIAADLPTENMQKITFEKGNVYICQLITNDTVFSQKVRCDIF